MANFGTLSVPADAVALLAGAAWISVEGALAEEFGEFTGVEVGGGHLAAQLQVGPEGLVLEQQDLGSHEEEEHTEYWFNGAVVQHGQEIFLLQVRFPREERGARGLDELRQRSLILAQQHYLHRFL